MKRKLVFPLLAAFVAIAFVASNSYAALNYYLKIEGKESKARIVRCPDGQCSITDLEPGTYTISLVDEHGKPSPTTNVSFKGVMTIPPTASLSRDAASGLPTGKRMHKPITITKEIDKSSPKLELVVPNNDQGTGAGDAGVSIHWTLEVRVQKIEMK